VLELEAETARLKAQLMEMKVVVEAIARQQATEQDRRSA
jgi:hypothetical protein